MVYLLPVCPFQNESYFSKYLVRAGPHRGPLDMRHRIYSVPRKCNRCAGETGKLLKVSIAEHKNNLKESSMEKSKLANMHVKETLYREEGRWGGINIAQ